MTKLDRILRAFADETRLRILHLLSNGELCVCDLMSVLDEPQSKVSRHLGYLKRSGLVTDRKEGKWRHYSLGRARSRFPRRLLACVARSLEEAPILKQDVRTLSKLKTTRCS